MFFLCAGFHLGTKVFCGLSRKQEAPRQSYRSAVSLFLLESLSLFPHPLEEKSRIYLKTAQLFIIALGFQICQAISCFFENSSHFRRSGAGLFQDIVLSLFPIFLVKEILFFQIDFVLEGILRQFLIEKSFFLLLGTVILTSL